VRSAAHKSVEYRGILDAFRTMYLHEGLKVLTPAAVRAGSATLSGGGASGDVEGNDGEHVPVGLRDLLPPRLQLQDQGGTGGLHAEGHTPQRRLL
jgi:hypothetical protein